MSDETMDMKTAVVGDATTAISCNASGSTLNVEYDTLPNNQPVTFGNFFTWWQQPSEQVPWGTGIVNGKVAPVVNTPTSSQAIANIYVGTEAYLVAWSVGSDISNIVATYFLPPSGDGSGIQPSLSVESKGPNSVVFNYTMPTGSTPGNFKHWVGIWEGTAASYTLAPTWSAQVTDNASDSAVAVNGVQLRRGRSYVAAYFAGGWAQQNPSQTTMAVTCSFDA